MDTSQSTLIASSLERAQSQYCLFIDLRGLSSLNTYSQYNIGNYVFSATNRLHVLGSEFLSLTFMHKFGDRSLTNFSTRIINQGNQDVHLLEWAALWTKWVPVRYQSRTPLAAEIDGNYMVLLSEWWDYVGLEVQYVGKCKYLKIGQAVKSRNLRKKETIFSPFSLSVKCR